MSVLEVKHVTKYFGKRLVLSDINFSVAAHDLKIAKRMADKVLIMRQGAAVEFGTREQIFNAPREFYTQELLKAAFL